MHIFYVNSNKKINMKTNFLNILLVLIIAISIFSGLDSWAGDLTPPFSLETTGVLPPHIRSFRFTGLNAQFDRSFDNQGSVQPLGQSFNKPVTWGELVRSVKDPYDRMAMKSFLASQNESLDSVVGETRGQVSSDVQIMLPSVAYGLNKRWTLGIAVPVITSSVHVSTAWVANERIPHAMEKMTEAGRYNKVKGFEPRLQNLIQTQVSDKGYQPLSDQRKTQIGDMVLVAKYLAVDEGDFTLALQPKVVLPTGRIKNTNNIVDVGGGDGQWDLGVSGIANYKLPYGFIALASMGYTTQLPTTQMRRIPEDADHSLSSDIDRSTRIDLGDIVQTSLGLQYSPWETMSFGLGGTWQYKNSDLYSPSRNSQIASSRYSLLSKDTEQVMTTGQAQVSYSTVPLYKSHRFPVPMEANINHTRILMGRNVKANSLTSIGLALYF